MEVFDVVDENDNIIGEATKKECHSNPKLIHHAVHFTLIDKSNGKIFLTQRSYKKENDPRKLCFPGEHMLKGESYKDGLKRGVKEELGLTEINFKEVGRNIFRMSNQTELIRFFLVYFSGEELKVDRSEIIDLIWLTPEDLLRGKDKYSDMTRYWVENIKWKKLLN